MWRLITDPSDLTVTEKCCFFFPPWRSCQWKSVFHVMVATPTPCLTAGVNLLPLNVF